MLRSGFYLIISALCLTVSTALHASTGTNLSVELITNSDTENHSINSGEPASISFRITGKFDGGAVSGLHPGAWIRPRLEGRTDCKDAIRNYLTVGPNASQDIDLNSYRFITLNADNTVAVMDPKLNLASANLVGLRKLPGKIEDWRLQTVDGEIILALPNEKKLVVLSALTGEILRDINLPLPPQQFVDIELGQLLWVATEKALMAVDLKKGKILQTISLSSGNQYIAASQQQQQIWIYADHSGVLIAVDAVLLKELWRRQLPSGLLDIHYSSHADKLYLGSHDQQQLTSLFPGQKTRVETSALKIRPQQLAVTPDGRWLFILDESLKQVVVMDTATGQPAHHLLFKHAFDQLVFSEQFGYLHHTSSPNVSLIHLDSLDSTTTPSLIEVPFGVKPPGKSDRGLLLVTPLPEGGAIMVTNPADKTLYMYMENGMLAPDNLFKVYTAAPLSLLVHDGSLTETNPGLYETKALVSKPGEYEIVFYLNNPLVVSCIPLTVRGEGKRVEALMVKPVRDIHLIPTRYHAGKPATIKMRLEIYDYNADSKVHMLLFKPGSNWQRRLILRPDKNNELNATVVFPEQGRYLLGLEAPHLGLTLTQKTIKTIEVQP